MCGCGEGQTGGGQNLNDEPGTRIIREGDGTEQMPDDENTPVDPLRPLDEKRPDGKIPPPHSPKDRHRPRHIFGKKSGQDCPDCPHCPEHGGDGQPEEINPDTDN